MSRIYIGNLPMDVRERELDDVFYKFGRITDIEIKRPQRPPAFAFISFTDSRDAKDAVHYRDNYDFDGGRLRVEMMKGAGGGHGGAPPDVMRGSGTSAFRVVVTGLPKSASWQDLKDHFKKSCDVTRTDVDRTGKGCVEFKTERDLEDGLKLDRSMFQNPFSESEIRVKLPDDARRGRSDSRSRSRSPKRKSRSRSGGKGRSRSPKRKSRSGSRERGGGGGGRRGGGSNSRSRSRSKGKEDDDDKDVVVDKKEEAAKEAEEPKKEEEAAAAAEDEKPKEEKEEEPKADEEKPKEDETLE